MPSIKNSAVEMVQAIKKGEISSEELVKSLYRANKKKRKRCRGLSIF